MTKLEKAKGVLPEGWAYQIPTEAQWEYSCRAATKTAYCFGDATDSLHRFANFADQRLFQFDPSQFRYAIRKQDDGFAQVAPVGSFLANAWNIHDMHGNLAEWVSDSYQAKRKGDP